MMQGLDREMHDAATHADETPAPHRRRRAKLWAWAIALLVLLALLLTPPYLNVKRLERRIVMSMSQSLGRPVHLDKVSAHLLPMPGFTIENLVVSDDPAFGDEPVIRANRVTATLRLSSLWRRQVEFSTIRFDVDENGAGPSVNLVRRADGRWNLESILLHAAQTTTAPTAQQKAGPAPRFPYIEATGARLNIKLGVEKLPYSLTDADFALWLSSPQQWHLRLSGKPLRTDTDASDTGTMTVEGTLEKAAHVEDVPLDLSAHWSDVPLGEASRLVTGNDAGWRGHLDVNASIHGTLGKADSEATVNFIDLRRSDFMPAETLQVKVECSGQMALTIAVIHDPQCSLPTPPADGSPTPGALHAIADAVDLTGLHLHGAHVGMTDVPLTWMLDWARLFSRRIPSVEHPPGTVSGTVALLPDEAGAMEWRGKVQATVYLTQTLSQAATSTRTPIADSSRGSSGAPPDAEYVFVVGLDEGTATLAPVNVSAPGAKFPLTMSGSFDRKQYYLRLTGTATPEELNALTALAPPLGDNLPPPVAAVSEGKPERIDVECTRPWHQPQVCTAVAPPLLAKPQPKRRR